MQKFKVAKSKFLNALELPEDSLGGMFRLQIIGGHAILSGCIKLLQYKSTEIIALTKSGTVTFCGEHLKCVSFFDKTLEICGELNAVRFENK